MQDQGVDYNNETEWLQKVEEDLVGIDIQQNIAVMMIDVMNQLHKMPNWKSPTLDRIYRFWLKRFTILHQGIVSVLNEMVQTLNSAGWAVVRKTVHIQRDPKKDNVVENYRHSIS